VLANLQDQSLTKDVRQEKILACIEPMLDFEVMAMLVIGKSYWREPRLSDEKRDEFKTLFKGQLQHTYLQQLDLYSNEAVAFSKPIPEGRKLRVPTEVVSQDKKIAVDYKLYKKGPTGSRL